MKRNYLKNLFIGLLKTAPFGFIIFIIINNFEPYTVIESWVYFILTLILSLWVYEYSKKLDESSGIFVTLIAIYPMTRFFDYLLELYF